jgi:oligosaccharyltransferase complex subunit alpha (ribophorin I)
MYPAEIAQNENQLVRLIGSHYFLSPYPTENQKLVVKLPSSSIESFTKLSPYAVRGSSIHFGPYKDIQPFEVENSKFKFGSSNLTLKYQSFTYLDLSYGFTLHKQLSFRKVFIHGEGSGSFSLGQHFS